MRVIKRNLDREKNYQTQTDTWLERGAVPEAYTFEIIPAGGSGQKRNMNAGLYLGNPFLRFSLFLDQNFIKTGEVPSRSRARTASRSILMAPPSQLFSGIRDCIKVTPVLSLPGGFACRVGLGRTRRPRDLHNHVFYLLGRRSMKDVMKVGLKIS